MARAKKEPQRSFTERTIEDPEFEDLIEREEDLREGAAEHRKVRAAIADKAAFHGIKDGEKLRVGPYLVRGQTRSGGGFEVPAWEKVTVGGIESTRA